MSKVLITGGAGFIGVNTAAEFVGRGDEVVLLDNFDSWLYSGDLKRQRLEHLLKIGTYELIEGSITEEEVLRRAVSEFSPDLIIHLAALANPGKSIAAASLYAETNILGTIALLEAARRLDSPPKFVAAGSSSVYNDEQTPFIESAYPLRPRSPYGASKAAMESYLHLYQELYGLSIIVLRFFSVYGPWGRPDMAPMIFAEKIITGQPVKLVQDERQRDFTYISDVVPAIIAAASCSAKFEVLNIGRGQPHPIRALISALESAAEKTAIIEPLPTPPGEMRVTFADVTRAKQLLGYDPQVSLEEGAAELVQWMKEYYLPHRS